MSPKVSDRVQQAATALIKQYVSGLKQVLSSIISLFGTTFDRFCRLDTRRYHNVQVSHTCTATSSLSGKSYTHLLKLHMCISVMLHFPVSFWMACCRSLPFLGNSSSHHIYLWVIFGNQVIPKFPCSIHQGLSTQCKLCKEQDELFYQHDVLSMFYLPP